MITVPETVKKIILNSPFLELSLSENIINLSSLARKIKPEIEKKTMKPVSTSSIIMALRRISKHLKKSQNRKENYLKKIKNIIVRSNLEEYTFLNTSSFWDKKIKLLQNIRDNTDSFMTFTRGSNELTLIVSNNIKKHIFEIFNKEKIISHFDELSAIIIKLPPKSHSTPGVYYTILKRLAWSNINIVEVVSTLNEFTIVIKNKYIDNAFSVLKSLFWE